MAKTISVVKSDVLAITKCCPKCQGTGGRTVSPATDFSHWQPCGICHGLGWIVVRMFNRRKASHA